MNSLLPVFNDTPMKRVIGNGVTVISTDFGALGRQAARYALGPWDCKEEIPTRLILRGSL